MQETLNRLGLSVSYMTVNEREEDSQRYRDIAYATISKVGTNQPVVELKTFNLGQIEIVVERFLEAFALGYDHGYVNGRADRRNN
jgi:hypothetical protein